MQTQANTGWRPQVIHIGGTKRWLAHLLEWVAVAFRTSRKFRRDAKASRRSVLIIEPFGLGDVILHEPMVRALCGAGFDVTFCARAEWRALFPSIKWIDSRIAWGQHSKAVKYSFGSYLNSSFRRFLRELRMAGKESMVGIDTRGDIRSVLLLYAAGCREVITLSSYLGSDLVVSPAAAKVVEFSPEVRRWESNLRFLQPLQVPIDKQSPPHFPHLRKPVLHDTKNVGLISIAPWQGKWWEPEKWQALAAWLTDRGWGIRGFCGPNQAELAGNQLGPAVPIYECGSVVEWANQLQEVTALVTLDSGPMHLADALGIPVVALFGQGLLPLWAPSGNNSHVVTHQHDPGFQVHMPTEENTVDALKWMARIQVSEVTAALEATLERSSGSPLSRPTAVPSP